MCKKLAYLAEVLISSLPARLPFLQVIVCDKDHSALQSCVNAFNLDLMMMMMMLMMMMMIMYSSVLDDILPMISAKLFSTSYKVRKTKT